MCHKVGKTKFNRRENRGSNEVRDGSGGGTSSHLPFYVLSDQHSETAGRAVYGTGAGVDRGTGARGGCDLVR